MNARQKAKRYKGTNRYNLTVCKAYKKEIEFHKRKRAKLEAENAELKATIEMWIKGAPISQHKCRTTPTLRELKLGIGAPVQCPKCRNAAQETRNDM